VLDPKATQRVQPVILARAKELRRPMTPQEARLWQRPWLIILALSLFLIFTGSALAATADQFSTFNLQPSTENGAQVFQKWCSSCHGDRGQGLTPEWRAEWPAGKQNCWQSKCHAGNHPPDGFSFPKNVPALIGPNALTKFTTAQDLYVYTREAMPYWSPNLLTDAEYQAITVFLVEENYAERGFSPPVLLPADLMAVSLHPDAKAEEKSETPPKVSLPTPGSEASSPTTQIAAFDSLSYLWLSLFVLSGVLIIVLVGRVVFRSH
jgi:mono/diheme cytochrome c family protein